MAALTFRSLTLGYERHPAVHHLHGTVEEGELLAVIGPNGAGKSTLLKGIVGALAPLDGTIDRNGLKAADIAYLPQIAEIDLSFPISVFDLVASGLWRRTGAFGGIGRAERARVAAAIDTVRLDGFEARAIGTLSGGQMQRALFARVVLQDAPLILLDEPFGAIDSSTVADLIDLVTRWHGERRTVLVVLHDLDAVRTHFPRTLLLAREAVAWGPTDAVLTADHLSRARHLTEAWDAHAKVCGRAA